MKQIQSEQIILSKLNPYLTPSHLINLVRGSLSVGCIIMSLSFILFWLMPSFLNMKNISSRSVSHLFCPSLCTLTKDREKVHLLYHNIIIIIYTVLEVPPQKQKELRMSCTKIYSMPRMLVITYLASTCVTDIWWCYTINPIR